MGIARLTEAETAQALAQLPEWRLTTEGKAITRTWVFADFPAAFGFMAKIALLAHSQDHHPDWSNRYNRVTISLTTHDAEGLSARDLALAKAIDALG